MGMISSPLSQLRTSARTELITKEKKKKEKTKAATSSSKIANPEAEVPPAKSALPWRTRLVVSLISTLSDTSRRSDGTINRRLLSFLDLKSAPSPTKPIRSVISSDIPVDDARDLLFRLYTLIGSNTEIICGCCASGLHHDSIPINNILPVMVFFHGGGFSFLSALTRSYDIVCRRFALKLPAVVVSVNYCLTPEHRFPSQYDDGFDVLKFLDENQDTMRIYPNPFFGGGDRSEPEIRLTSSMLVPVPRTDWCWKVFLPEGSNRDHYAVNVSGPNAEDISRTMKG
ncbi:hypothetical protein JCGZ_25886 [Jatropha curcas]|uniref:Alpha/beta hydrolase fold-3 domain-containing protein n=1 Tax=Jatropha curcas TaxID=180498 RepID=A0A067JXJ0_JATCU|nr:hypothetical protein JCGZ_25886 [Jatropha curcas]